MKNIINLFLPYEIVLNYLQNVIFLVVLSTLSGVTSIKNVLKKKNKLFSFLKKEYMYLNLFNSNSYFY